MLKIILSLLSFLPNTTLSGASAGTAVGELSPGVLLELWRNLPGDKVAALTHQISLSIPPSKVSIIPQADSINMGDSYGARYTVLLRVPKSGEYRFYLSSDDSSELWLGKDGTQRDLSCVATVNGYSAHREWHHQANQVSAPVYLKAGEVYFFQVLHKEGRGADHMSVAWTGPDVPKPALIPPSSFFKPPQKSTVKLPIGDK